MKIEVGEFCRFKNGNIAKIVNIDRFLYFDREVYEEDGMPIHCLIREKIYLDFIVKHSKNIIDLIQEGDIVNGCEVVSEKYTYIGINLINVDSEISYGWGTGTIPENEIKTILTKEQYEKNSYKIGE